MYRRIYDCVLYDGELEVLLIRLHELQDAVDVFVIVESTHTWDGQQKPLHLRERWAAVRSFAPDIRYVIADEAPVGTTPSDWDRHRRDSIQRGLADALPSDIICLSDVVEIPSAKAVAGLRVEHPAVVTFALTPYCCYLNVRGTVTPPADAVGICAFPYSALERHTPSGLRRGVREGSIPARTLPNSGWHFAHLGEAAHPGHGTAAARTLQSANGWTVTNTKELPRHVQANAEYEHLLLRPARRSPNFPTRRRGNGAKTPKVPRPDAPPNQQPVIVCPYLYDEDKQRVVEAFGLDSAPGADLPFYLWQDDKRIGPERAFQHCWSQFSDRDVVIVHTDMRPLPHQSGVDWYQDLLSAVQASPGAAMVACDLLFPGPSPSGEWYVQCAGGYFAQGEFGHIGGRSESGAPEAGPAGILYGERFAITRRAQWLTFGGIYIRREAIDMIGGFDARYEWAYVMDVDYCVEAAVRGLTMVQAPVNLIHEENGTTREFLQQEEYQAKVRKNVQKFYAKWSWFLSSLPAGSK